MISAIDGEPSSPSASEPPGCDGEKGTEGGGGCGGGGSGSGEVGGDGGGIGSPDGLEALDTSRSRSGGLSISGRSALVVASPPSTSRLVCCVSLYMSPTSLGSTDGANETVATWPSENGRAGLSIVASPK